MRSLLTLFLSLTFCCCILADDWQLYDDFSTGNIESTRWVSNWEFGGFEPIVSDGKCVLSGEDTDGKTEAGGWEDGANSSIYAAVSTSAIKADLNPQSVIFNNDPGLGEVPYFEFYIDADLNNGMLCAIYLNDSGEGLEGAAEIEDAYGEFVNGATFTASYDAISTYSIEIQNTSILFKKGDSLLFSWQPGEEVSFTGFSIGASGAFCNYAVTVDNVYTSDNPDYGNTPETAYQITADGTTYFGTLETSSDVDWLFFSKEAYGRYRFTLTNADSNWKYMHIYHQNMFGDLVEQNYTNAYNSSSNLTLFFEPEYDCFIKIRNGAGNYAVRVDYLDTTYPDAYADTCESATMIASGYSVVGTLDHTNPDLFDTDWFEFETQPLHIYQITLTRTANSNAAFEVYNESCENIAGGQMSYTLASWFGENYKIRAYGGSDKIGQYYTIEVTDFGVQSYDYGNTPENAYRITPDGEEIFGLLDYSANYHADEDWFVFSKQPYGRYRFTLINPEGNWKYMYIYQQNQFGDLIQQTYINAYTASTSTTLYFEPEYDCFFRISNTTGNYSFTVEHLDTIVPDNFSDSCSDPTQIYVDAEPTVGILDHPIPSTIDTDWFVFNTQPLHKYQITLTRTANSNVAFEVCNDSCGSIAGGQTSFTLVSWFGESYKLRAYGGVDKIGQYYNLQVTDLGLQPHDWPNTYGTAATAVKDGSWIDGQLGYTANYNADVDWFKFVAPIAGSYVFKLHNIDSNWKYIHIYKANEVGTPVHITNTNAYSSISNTTLSLTPGLHYVSISNAVGDYKLSILSPEPQCGDLEHPYPVGDVNKDCYFDMNDIAMMASDWLSCTNPNPPCEFMP